MKKLKDKSGYASVEGINFGNECDLHFFHPADTKVVVNEFIRQAQEAGLSTLRLVHGKGRSVKKLQVHAILESHPAVASFRDEGANWGATLITLKNGPREGL